MSVPIRAIYSRGQLRLIDEVELSEGQEIALVILSEKERIDAALGDLLVEMPEPDIDGVDEAALRKEIASAFRGTPPLSEDIIAERRAGPCASTFSIAVRW